jgi:hypothetical protein
MREKSGGGCGGGVTGVEPDPHPPPAAMACENERSVASLVHVIVAEPRFEAVEHTLVVKLDNLFRHLKLLPEYRHGLELLNEDGSTLA